MDEALRMSCDLWGGHNWWSRMENSHERGLRTRLVDEGAVHRYGLSLVDSREMLEV